MTTRDLSSETQEGGLQNHTSLRRTATVPLGYRLRIALLVLLPLLYPLLVFSGPRNGHAEFYPFFSWNLFSSSSNTKADVVIIVREIDGRKLEGDTLFFDLTDEFSAANMRDIRLAKLLDDYYFSNLRGETQLLPSIERVIEGTYMKEAQNIAYDIAVIWYDPLERYENGTLLEVEILASHRKDLE